MPKSLWNDSFYVKAYKAARVSNDLTKIARILGVSGETLASWRKKKPDLEAAIQEGWADRSEVFSEYVYKRLSPKLRDLWDQIHTISKTKSGIARVEALLENQGKTTRQRLFLHALACFNFNPTKAGHVLGVSEKLLSLWKKDPEFGKLIKEMDWHRGNFFEEALFKLVKKGDTAAVLFANRTYNKDRGYSEKISIEGEITHKHEMFNLDKIDLPLEVKVQVLEAIEKQYGKLDQGEIIDGNVIDSQPASKLSKGERFKRWEKKKLLSKLEEKDRWEDQQLDKLGSLESEEGLDRNGSLAEENGLEGENSYDDAA